MWDCSSTTRANTLTRALATMLRYFPRNCATNAGWSSHTPGRSRPPPVGESSKQKTRCESGRIQWYSSWATAPDNARARLSCTVGMSLEARPWPRTCGQVPMAFVCLSNCLEGFLQVLATVDERHLTTGTSPDKATTHFCENGVGKVARRRPNTATQVADVAYPYQVGISVERE